MRVIFELQGLLVHTIDSGNNDTKMMENDKVNPQLLFSCFGEATKQAPEQGLFIIGEGVIQFPGVPVNRLG